MVCVMATGREVFSIYVAEIFASIEFKNAGTLLFYAWKYLTVNLAGKAAQDWRNRWAMVPGIGGSFWCFGRY